MSKAQHKTQTTTVRIPRNLYEEARASVENGASDAKSLNDLLVDSLSQRLKQLRRQEIDAEFAQMKDDADYRLESEAVSSRFAMSDWEALRTVENRKK